MTCRHAVRIPNLRFRTRQKSDEEAGRGGGGVKSDPDDHRWCRSTFRGRRVTFFFSPRTHYAKRVQDGIRGRGGSTSALLILFACNPSTSHPRCRITKSSGGEGGFSESPGGQSCPRVLSRGI